MKPVLEDLIASGLVHYHFLTNATTEVQLEEPLEGRSINWQMPVYSHCLDRFGKQHRWMGERIGPHTVTLSTDVLQSSNTELGRHSHRVA